MIWFVINRLSGNGKGKKVWQEVEQALDRLGIEYGRTFTQKQGHAEEIARELANKPGISAIVAVGGDGTVHEVANGVAGTSVPVGCIPAGSGDDFARSLGYPLLWKGALDRVLKLNSRRIDAGLINGKLFAISAGIGFDGEVAKLTNRSWYKRWFNQIRAGRISYVVTVLRLLITYKPCRVRLDVDGIISEHDGVWLMAIANMPGYGGGMKICPDAKDDDGWLHLCLVEGISRMELLRFFPRVYDGTHVTHPAVRMLAGRKIRMESGSPMTIHMDGEFGGETPAGIPVAIEVLPDRLLVI